MVSGADKRPLTQSPDHTCQRDSNWTRGVYHVIKSETLLYEPTDFFLVSEADRFPLTQGPDHVYQEEWRVRGEECVSSLESETLHSKPKEFFMTSETDRPPNVSPDNAAEEMEEREKRIYILHWASHNIGAQEESEKCIIGLAARLPPRK